MLLVIANVENDQIFLVIINRMAMCFECSCWCRAQKMSHKLMFGSSRTPNCFFYIFIHSLRFVSRRWSSYISQIYVVAASSEVLVPFLHRRLHGGLSNALMALIQWHASNFLEGGGRELLVKHAFLLGIRTSDSQSRVARVFLHVHQPGYLNGHVVWGSWKQGNEERLRLPTSRN